MTTGEMTLNEIRARGYAALARELGPVGYARFLQQFEAGGGDYSVERHPLYDTLDADELERRIVRRRGEKKEE